MAFTMSYGITPPPARTEPAPKVIASQKPALQRGRKQRNLQTQAQALFDPAPAQVSEVPSALAAMNAPEDGAVLLALSKEDEAAQSAPDPSPA